MPLSNDPKDWKTALNAMQSDYPRDWDETLKMMIAFFFIFFSFALPWDWAVWLLSKCESIFAIDDSLITWRQDEYMPALKELVADQSVPWYNVIFFGFKLQGIMIKMLWAWVWQEETFTFLPKWIFTPTAMWFLSKLTPHINFYANMLSWFP